MVNEKPSPRPQGARSGFGSQPCPHGLTETDKKSLLPRNYDLGNERARALYVLLSKDKIQAQPLWSDFKQHVTLRHDIVHKGKRATAQQALRRRASCSQRR